MNIYTVAIILLFVNYLILKGNSNSNNNNNELFMDKLALAKEEIKLKRDKENLFERKGFTFIELKRISRQIKKAKKKMRREKKEIKEFLKKHEKNKELIKKMKADTSFLKPYRNKKDLKRIDKEIKKLNGVGKKYKDKFFGLLKMNRRLAKLLVVCKVSTCKDITSKIAEYDQAKKRLESIKNDVNNIVNL